MARRSGILHRSNGIPLAAKVAALRGRGLARAKEEIRLTVESLIDEGFERETDPTGHPWAPRKPPTGGWPLLQKTLKMFKSFQVFEYPRKIVVKNFALSKEGRPYPLFHQFGTRKMKARRMAPVRGLPSRWRAELDRAVARALKAVR